MNLLTILAYNVQSRRLALGLAQDTLAYSAGIGTSTMWKIEAGLANARLTTLTALATALHCSPHELITPKEQ